ncbi:MAG: lysophospholipid acyltransferase family protein [Cyanobacteria bacterium J06635_11]
MSQLSLGDLQIQDFFSLIEAIKPLGNLPKPPAGSILDGWSLDARSPEFISKIMPLMRWLYDHYYQVNTAGWENIPTDENVMLVGSHNGGIPSPDMHMMLYDWMYRFGPDKPLYGLMHPSVWKASPTVASIATQMGAVRAHPKMGLAALNQNANIALYPGGAQDVFRPHALRHKIYFHNRKGFIKLALKKAVPIVPMISLGAHSTLVVLADIYPQIKQLHDWGMPWLMDIDPEVFPVYLGLPWGLAAGPIPNIPLPIKLYTRICAPIRFERTGAEALQDKAYVDDCYNKVQTQMQTALDELVANH